MLMDIFLPEVAGTATLLLLGCGVVANVVCGTAKGQDGNFLMIAFGWGLGVFAGVFVAAESGAHINPAVTLGLLINGDISFVDALVYWIAQLIGAFVGAVLAWLAYKQELDDPETPADAKRDVFCTSPANRAAPWNMATEVIGTFVLVFVILAFGDTPAALGPLLVAFLVVGIGVSLGGPTGYAINPARDLGPRIAHFVLPIKGKTHSDWGYAWVPVVAPLIGAALAAFTAPLMGYV